MFMPQEVTEKEGTQLSDAVTEELLRLEEERCRAVSAGDVDNLGRLLTDDLTHTHVTGRTEDKATYLAALGWRPRTTTRVRRLALDIA
jgi:hypothetical protein